jgi:hypothetical protein
VIIVADPLPVVADVGTEESGGWGGTGADSPRSRAQPPTLINITITQASNPKRRLRVMTSMVRTTDHLVKIIY